MAFQCQVCFEHKHERLPLPKLATGNGDVLRAADCDHPICQTCMATWVTTRVQEQLVFNVRCPFVGCTNGLFEQDVGRLVLAGELPLPISESFAGIRTRDYSARAQALPQELLAKLEENKDFDVIHKLWETMRLCPRCSLAIERSAGCNSFFCICGHHFDFATAPHLFGNDIQNYSNVIDMAQILHVSLEDAQKYGSDVLSGKNWSRQRALAAHRLVTRIAVQRSGAEADNNVALAEAWKLHQQAKAGDTEARKIIRAAKHNARATVHEEDAPCMELWEDVEIPAENCFTSSPDVPNVDDTSVLIRKAFEIEKGQELAAAVGLSPTSVFDSFSMVLAGSKSKKDFGNQTRHALVATNQTETVSSVGYPAELEVDAPQ